jgi:hypothetical protein
MDETPNQLSKDNLEGEKEEVKVTNRVSVWRKDLQKLEFEETCCICTKEMPFLRCSCNHNFHLSCLRDWRQKNSTCPLCRKEIDDRAKFYCNICREYFRWLNLSEVNEKQLRLEIICPHCTV